MTHPQPAPVNHKKRDNSVAIQAPPKSSNKKQKSFSNSLLAKQSATPSKPPRELDEPIMIGHPDVYRGGTRQIHHLSKQQRADLLEVLHDPTLPLAEEITVNTDGGRRVALRDLIGVGDLLGQITRDFEQKTTKATKQFNVRGRAEPTTSGKGRLYTKHRGLVAIGEKHGLDVRTPKQFEQDYPKQRFGTTQSKLNVKDPVFGGNHVEAFAQPHGVVAYYVGPDFPKQRGANPRAKSKAKASKVPEPKAGSSVFKVGKVTTGTLEWTDKQVTVKAKIRGAVLRGDVTKKQAAAMGNTSARDYVLAHQPRWTKASFEWLHLFGSALGGPNALGNLVAGTFDANTQMLAVEQGLRNYCANDENDVTPQSPVYVTVTANLMDGTWIAEHIAFAAEHAGQELTSGSFSGITSSRYSTLAFDIFGELALGFALGSGGTDEDYSDRDD